MTNIINYRRRGGLRFVTIGRLNVQWSVKRKPVAAPIDDWTHEPIVSAATGAQVRASFKALGEAIN